jgi:hypothetical protein
MTTPDQRELIHQLLDDVTLIEEHLATGIPKSSVMRTCFAPILRRWMVDGAFFMAQRLIKPVRIPFATINDTGGLALCEAGGCENWMGLILFGTLGFAVTQRTAEHLTTGMYDPTILEMTPLAATKFFAQRMFFWKGSFYTREDMVKIHANKLGGVHLDFRRADDELHINEIRTYFGYELIGTGGQSLRGQELEWGRNDRERRPFVYDATELIAMDTARIFAGGIRGSESAFTALLN